MQQAYKCVGVWHNEYRLYYDGKYNEFFILTPYWTLNYLDIITC